MQIVLLAEGDTERALAKPAQKYIKPIEMSAILKGKDLTIVAQQCPEFRALLNTLLSLSGLDCI